MDIATDSARAFTASSFGRCAALLGPHDDVFVLKSKGKRGVQPFARATLLKFSNDRWLVRYGDSSTFHVRARNVVPLFSNGLLACATTAEYRLAARTQPRPGEICVEIGCDLGSCCERLAKAVAPDGRVVGIDKAPDRIAIARERLPSLHFVVADVLQGTNSIGHLRPHVCCIDINGSRAYDAVATVVRWVQSEWKPRLVIVKSSNYVRHHFPDSLPDVGAPNRHLRDHLGHAGTQRRQCGKGRIVNLILRFVYTYHKLRDGSSSAAMLRRLLLACLSVHYADCI